MTMTDPLKPSNGPELFLALVGAVGTDLSSIYKELETELRNVGYETHKVKLSSSLHAIYPELDQSGIPEDRRIKKHMKAGSRLRRGTDRGDILALLAAAEIRGIRENQTDDPDEPAPNTAYIIDSIKHPDEISTLRDIYGKAFHVISVYSDRDSRMRDLARTIAESRYSSDTRKFEAKALRLIRIDEYEAHKLGQRMADAYPLADYFVDGRSNVAIREGVSRFVKLLFDHPFISPTSDEFGMFHAHGSALRSLDLSRQVGAAITRKSGEILSVGCNEVPKAFGGQYWEGDSDDFRDFQKGLDSNVRYRQQAILELVSRLKESGLLKAKHDGINAQELFDKITKGYALRPLRLDSIIEYGRAVHAEMAAITDAAKRGIQVESASLYSTTFPCHLCAKHIISAGIREVIYIEPYPKNQVAELYGDSVHIDPPTEISNKIVFRSFVGVAPRSYSYFFQAIQGKKDRTGKAISWEPKNAQPRLKRFVSSYLMIEGNVCEAIPDYLGDEGVGKFNRG